MKLPSPILAAGTIAVLALGMGGRLSYAASAETGTKVKPKSAVIQPKESADKLKMVHYPIPTRYATPYGIAVDSKNTVWVTLMSGNSLGKLNPATGEFKEYRVPSTEGLPESDWEYSSKERTSPKKVYNVYSVGSPGNVIVDKNDNVWFVMHLGNSLVRFVPSTEEMTEFILPTKNAQPYDLAEDGDGNIWFIEKNASKFGYLDHKKKKAVEVKLPDAANLMGISVDSGNRVWLSEVNGNYIGRYDPKTKKFRKFTIPSDLAQPGKMRFGEKGQLWFCAPHSRQIGVLYTDRDGMFGMVDVPGYNAAPQALVPAKDGRVWYVDSMMNMVGFFDQKLNAWSTFEIPSHGAQPMSIAIDGKGDIWFTESDRGVNQVSKVVVSSVPAAPVSADTGHPAGSQHSH